MSGGGGSPSSTTTVNQLYSPEEAAWREQVMSEAARIYNTTAPQITNAPFPGAKPVGASPDTQNAQNYLRDYAGGQGGSFANTVMGANAFGLGPVLFPESNPALQGYMDAAIRPITQAYTDPGGVFSNIRSAAVASGGYGGSRQGIAEGVAGGRYLQTVADTTAKIASEGYGQGLDTFSRALALSPQTFNLGLQPGITQSAVGTDIEAYGQAQEDYDAAARAWALNAPWAPLQNFANVVFGGASPGTQTTTTGATPKGSTGLTALGGAATGALLGSKILPGWGTVIGAGAGLIMGLMNS